MEANPLYYGTKPAIQRIVFLFLEEDAAFAAAQAGEVQVVSGYKTWPAVNWAVR